MPESGWVEPELWYQELPAVHVAALALIRDSVGRVLLVKPSYRPAWSLPGGMADEGEPPADAVEREVQEELGLKLPAARLLVVDWGSPRGERQRSLASFVFDCGIVDDPPVVLQVSELEQWRFVTLHEAQGLMPQRTLDRLRTAAHVADHGQDTALLVDGAGDRS